MKANTRIIGTIMLAALVAGCGGGDGGSSGGGGGDAAIERTSKVSGETRIERCIEQYPDSTAADCEEWEGDELLADDGSHQDHEG